MAVDENIARGMSPEEARREALRSFGGVALAKEMSRDRGGIPVVETLVQDLRFSVRSLAKRPAFTAVAVLTLALGIGANTAIFSVVNALVLSPPRVADADRVAAIWQTGKERRSKGYVSYLLLQDLRTACRSFESVAAYKSSRYILVEGGQAERLEGMRVTSDFLPLLGVSVARGRGFEPDEEKRGAPPVAIVGYRFWKERLGGSESAVGSTLTLNDKAFTVIGVLPPEFEFSLGPKQVEVMTTVAEEEGNLGERGAGVLKLLGKLREGETLANAQAELTSVAESLEQQYPRYNTDVTLYAIPLDEEIVGPEVRRALWVLLGAVSFLLLIACTNVTNLMLVRASTRQRELALRAALGAGTWRIALHVLTESLVLAALSFGAGLLLAVWGLGAIKGYAAGQLPRLDEVAIDGRVLAFTGAVSVLTALLVGMLPVLKASRPDLNGVLKTGTTGARGGGSLRVWRDALVVTEVALGLVLLVGAGLMVRSFDSLMNVNPGFDPKNVLTGQILLTRDVYERSEEKVRYVDATLERLRAIPGVESAAFAGPMLFSGGNVITDFRIEGRPEPEAGREPYAAVRSVTPDYFQSIRIPLRKGRFFTDRDRRGGVGAAIVNETLAASYFPNEDPIGKVVSNIGANQNDGDPKRWEIVGVVGDVHHASLTKAASPEMFLPYQQNSWDWGSFFVRTAGDPTASARAFTDAIREGDPTIAVMDVMPLTQAISTSVAQARFYTMLFSLFGVVGLLLMLTGVYSVVSYGVAQQTQEIGIRMALGAQARDVLSLVVRKGMVLALVGVGLGLAGAAAVTRLMETLLFGVTATDPATYLGMAAVMVFVALAACYIPARRAAKVDPLVALRYE
jgi:putative ABC transport system permease protein